MQIEIYTPSQKLFTGEASEVVAPATTGYVGILPQHTDYLSTLKDGTLSLNQNGNKIDFQITGGLMTVSQNQVIILVDGLVT